ncbi:g9314 [Coccomyxa elongata]
MADAKDEKEKKLQESLADCVLTSSWIFCLGGVALSVPFGVKYKSYLPLVYFGLGGTVLDMLNGYMECNAQRKELAAYQEALQKGSQSAQSDL